MSTSSCHTCPMSCHVWRAGCGRRPSCVGCVNPGVNFYVVLPSCLSLLLALALEHSNTWSRVWRVRVVRAWQQLTGTLPSMSSAAHGGHASLLACARAPVAGERRGRRPRPLGVVRERLRVRAVSMDHAACPFLNHAALAARRSRVRPTRDRNLRSTAISANEIASTEIAQFYSRGMATP